MSLSVFNPYLYHYFVAIYSSLMSLSYGHVACWNFTPTGPHELLGQGLLFPFLLPIKASRKDNIVQFSLKLSW